MAALCSSECSANDQRSGRLSVPSMVRRGNTSKRGGGDACRAAVRGEALSRARVAEREEAGNEGAAVGESGVASEAGDGAARSEPREASMIWISADA